MFERSAATRRTLDAAERRARARVASRPTVGPDEIVAASVSDAALRPHAVRLLRDLAAALGVEPGALRPEDRLADLLTVRRPDLPEVSDADWAATGLRDRVQVHVYEIMHLVEGLATREGWRRQWATLAPRPRDEEEWIDAIAAMRVDEFLRFFALTMPAEGPDGLRGAAV